jgi:pheromone shutdown protein TraB
VTARIAESRIEEYWDWVAVALFLLLAVDLLTTLAAARLVGTGAESNPLMRWLLGRGVLTVIGAHLAAVVLVTGCFRLLVDRLRRTPAPANRYFALAIEAWLGFLVAVGLGVFANNLAVIVLGRSLL